MVITKSPVVVPTRLDFLSLLALIGIFGFFAQVNIASLFFGQLTYYCRCSTQTLLTMGLQRETAGRGAMAIYLQVSFSASHEESRITLVFQIIFATILERIFFYSIPSTLSVVGTCIIMASAIYVAVSHLTRFNMFCIIKHTHGLPVDENKCNRKYY